MGTARIPDKNLPIKVPAGDLNRQEKMTVASVGATPQAEKKSRSKRNRQEETNQSLPLEAGTGAKSAQKLQELVMSFKSLKFRQVNKLKDGNALKVYQELQNGELNWTTVMEDKGPNSILAVCKRHEENIQEFSKRIAMLKRHRTIGSVLSDSVLSDQTQPPTELTLTPPAVSTPGSAEATFASDTSIDVTLGNEITKANTTFCGATLVISLTTTTSVSAFAVGAILKVEADQLFDTHANMLSDQVKVLHRGVEMSKYE